MHDLVHTASFWKKKPLGTLNVKRLQCQIILRSLGARKPKGHKQDTKKSTEIA